MALYLLDNNNKSAKRDANAASWSEKIESSSKMTTTEKFGQLKLQMFHYEYKNSKFEHEECTNPNCRYNYDDDDDSYDTLAPFASDVLYESAQRNICNSKRCDVNELKSEDYDCVSSFCDKHENYELVSSDDSHGYVSDQGICENGYEGDCDDEIEQNRNDNHHVRSKNNAFNLENGNISAIYADTNCGDDEYYDGYYYDDNVDGYFNTYLNT